jgi:hypothetical protein
LKDVVDVLEEFDDLKEDDQLEFIKELEDNTLLNKIIEENKFFNLKKIETEGEVAARKICKEIKLKPSEIEHLIHILKNIFKKHLPEFNKIRKDLIKEAPTFFALEIARLKKANPELAVQLEPKKHKAITPQYKKEEIKAKNKPIASLPKKIVTEKKKPVKEVSEKAPDKKKKTATI